MRQQHGIAQSGDQRNGADLYAIGFAGQRRHCRQTVTARAVENADAVAQPDLVEVYLLGVSGVFPKLVEARRAILVSEHAAGV